MNRLVRSVTVFLAAVLALSAADARDVPPHALQVRFAAESHSLSASARSALREGNVRLDLENAAGLRLTLMLLQTESGYVFHARAEGAGPPFRFDLADLLAEREWYDEFVDFFIFTLPPASGLHPCVHTVPVDGVVVGDFSAWECRATGTDRVAGRATTVWEYERLWGREGVAAVFNDPPVLAWIDDEWGVPIRVVFEDRGGVTRFDLVALDESAPDPALFDPDGTKNDGGR
jgi:hypothetical protein